MNPLKYHLSRGHQLCICWLTITTRFKGQGPTSPVLWLGALGVIITFELFTPQNFWVKLLLYTVRNSIRLSQIEIVWLLYKNFQIMQFLNIKKKPYSHSRKIHEICVFLRSNYFLTKSCMRINFSLGAGEKTCTLSLFYWELLVNLVTWISFVWETIQSISMGLLRWPAVL